VLQPLDPLTDTLGFALAAALGFLVGRTREGEPEQARRPGFRDFIVIALLGAVCARLEILALTLGMALATAAVLLMMRWQRPERTGITTELAALLTFALGALSLTPLRPLAAGLGIVLAAILTAKEELHEFALKKISQREFNDTLKFLALIFIVYPLLPQGGYGPFDFFEPRKIWLFVILVSGVSYVGYFLMKFLDPKKGMALTAVVGGLASTTAYTGGVAKLIAESPESAVPMARATILANAIQMPRLLLLAAVVGPELAHRAAPTLGGMMLAGLAAAALLGRAGTGAEAAKVAGWFKNPFTLWPALKFGLIFTVVLFLSHAGRAWLGDRGQLISSAIGGFIDVDAVQLSMINFLKGGETSMRDAILAVLIAITSNAIFKIGLACSSKQPAFYLRVAAGFAIMIGAGAAILFTFGPK
jgi:uncharacterized membrane protein (DUF4010 family)